MRVAVGVLGAVNLKPRFARMGGRKNAVLARLQGLVP